MHVIKKTSAMIICLVTCLLASLCVHAAPISTDERLIVKYFQEIDEKDWDEWLSLFSAGYATNMSNHLLDERYQEDKMGVYSIENVQDVSLIQKIDAQGYNGIIDSLEGEDHEVYLVRTELEVYTENDFYFDGTNYNLIFVGTVDDQRQIVGIRLPMPETIEAYVEENAAETYGIMRFGEAAELNSTSCSYNTLPSTIVVCRWRYGDGSCETVNFNQYVKTVTAAEYGYVNRDADYHYAGSIAVKMYGWYKIVISDPNDAYHVTDTNETDASHALSYQVYNPGTYWNSSVWGTVYNRVDAVWSYTVFGTNGRRMNTQYRSGYGSGNTGILYQETANDLANQGASYYTILNYFYGSSNESSGNILTGTSGSHVYYSETVNANGSILSICVCGHRELTQGPTTNSIILE